MKTIKFLFIVTAVSFSFSLSAQINNEEQIEEIIINMPATQKDTVPDLYIPQDLKECFTELDKLLTDDEKTVLKGNLNMLKLNKYLGEWLRVNWGLGKDSRIEQYFVSKMVDDPEDMSMMIIGYYQGWLREDHEEWYEFVKNTWK